jgi:AraC family transcriptional regulator of arabinose operon
MQDVLLCGYAYHTSKFCTTHRIPGLLNYLIRLQTEGSSIVLVDGQETRLVPWDIIFLPPGTVYELRVDEEEATIDGTSRIASGDYYLFCLNEWVEQWWNSSFRPWRVSIDPNETLLTFWKQLILEKSRLNEDNHELTSHLLRTLCLYLERIISEKDPSHNRPYTASRMKRYIEAHVGDTLMIEDVAKYVGLSVSRASQVFKECFGKTMIQYAMEIRLSGAVDRMNYTSMTLGEISDSCGFKSYTFFHRAFKEKYGVSPSDFRSKSRENHSHFNENIKAHLNE